MSKIAKKRKRLNIISNVYAFLVYALLYIPVAVMMVFSFNDQKYNYYWNGFTTQWYTKLFTNSTLVDSLIYSLIIAVLSTLISVFIGTIGALGLKRYEFKMKKFIDNMLYIPIIVPEIVLAVALLIIFLKVGVSMGMGTILRAKKILIMANGAAKRDAVATMLAGGLTTACPASLLNLHADVTLVCDGAALGR